MIASGNSRRWERAFRWLGVAAITVTLVLAGRLAVVVAATPGPLRMIEFVPLTGLEISPPAQDFAAGAAARVADPAIARVLIGDCVTGPPGAGGVAVCLDAIDYGLGAAPLSSELWLARARVLARQGVFGEPLATALANSYATGPLEGWIAAERLPFALRVRDFLPEDMVADIGRDIRLVVPNRVHARPLIAAYIADPFLRSSTWGVVEQFTTLDQQEQLIDWIRQTL